MSRKDINKEAAIKWCAKMYEDESWKSATSESIKHSYVISSLALKNTGRSHARIICSPNTSVQCAEEFLNKGAKSICILNFASYFNPGGDFLKGSISQEESLCHVSNLYNILSGLETYKQRRQSQDLTGLYGSDVIFTPNVKFVADNGVEYNADVISASAPNCNRKDFTAKERDDAINERIETILAIADKKGYDVLILGAWGCGVMNNNPKKIAKTFRHYLRKFDIRVNDIVFAIPNSKLLSVFGEELIRM